MGKRAFVVAGPEASGNRLVTAILVRAGCIGSGSTDGRLQHDLPVTEDPAVLIRHHLTPELFGELAVRGYSTTVVVCVRDPGALHRSQVQAGHHETLELAQSETDACLRRAFAAVPPEVSIHVMPYEALVLHREAAARRLVEQLGLDPARRGPLLIDGRQVCGIIDGNAKHYGVTVPQDREFLRGIYTGLVWSEELGMGWYPVTESPYNEAYFEKYKGYAATTMGRDITAARVAFVERHAPGIKLVDVGIGCGDFVETRGGETYGFDVNPAGIEWLVEREKFVDPRWSPFPAASYWDALEHIHEPRQILDQVEGWVFVSVPIFQDQGHVLRSRHFRPDEHVWYWTREGFERWMMAAGFRLRGHSDFETRMGRDGIETFAFERYA